MPLCTGVHRKNMCPSSKLLDLLIVLWIVIVAIPVSFAVSANFIISTLFFFALPSLYLLARYRGPRRRLFVGAALFGLLYGFLLDYFAEFNDAWSWAGMDQLVFPSRILGVVSGDVMVWFFFWVFLLVIFYEHFVEHDRKDTISPNIKYALAPGFVVFGILVLLHFLHPEVLRWDYAYFWLGLFTLPPFFFVVYRKPKLLLKFLKPAVFFVFLYMAYEITALRLNQWHFPGQYIGTISLAGVTLPIEEFVIWILMGSPIVLSYYELYVDDLR